AWRTRTRDARSCYGDAPSSGWRRRRRRRRLIPVHEPTEKKARSWFTEIGLPTIWSTAGRLPHKTSRDDLQHCDPNAETDHDLAAVLKRLSRVGVVLLCLLRGLRNGLQNFRTVVPRLDHLHRI